MTWLETGTAPRQSPDIVLDDPSADDPVVRDEQGNALGGVRIPQLEAPTATLDGRENSVSGAAPAGQNFCFLYGNTLPFEDQTLRTLYPDHAAFVSRFAGAVDALERDGYLLAPEAEQARAAARQSEVGRW